MMKGVAAVQVAVKRGGIVRVAELGAPGAGAGTDGIEGLADRARQNAAATRPRGPRSRRYRSRSWAKGTRPADVVEIEVGRAQCVSQ